MFPTHTLLSLIACIALTVVDASPVARGVSKTPINFATKISERAGGVSIVERDRTRLRSMTSGGQPGKRGVYPVNIDLTAIIYTTEVGVGTPPSNYTMVLDTGSSNTFIGVGSKSFAQTSSSQDTGHAVSASFGPASFSGMEWTDTVTLSPDLVVKQQSIGVATKSSGFFEVDGILGLGPPDLTQGTVAGVNEVPTVMNNLYTQKTIPEEVFGIYLKPATVANKGGELTVGGYDASVTTSPVVYVPLTTKANASHYWGIEESISYDDQTILSSTAGIVDTGAYFTYINTAAFKQYQALSGGTFDTATGLLKITQAQYAKLQPLVFNIGGTPFPLTPKAQIWPQSLNAFIGGATDAIYLVVTDVAQAVPAGSGIDFVMGYTFLERFYSVYDATNKRVGFACTPYSFRNDD